MNDRVPCPARRLVVPRGPSLFLVPGLAGFAVLAVLASTPLGCASASPPVRVSSAFETASGARITRDCGFSERVGARDESTLWLFCDTTVYDAHGALTAFIPGSSAALGSARHAVPSALAELPTPAASVHAAPGSARAPAAFLPQPPDLRRADGVPCLAPSYPASWSTGLARIPMREELLITYTNVCVLGLREFVLASHGIVEYTPSANILGTPTTLFAAIGGESLAPQERLGSPLFDRDGHLYAFASVCDDVVLGVCTAGRVFLARAPADRRDEADAYTWLTPDGWSEVASLAISVVPGATAIAVHVGDYRSVDHGLVMVETNSTAGTYRLWRAPRPEGPWTMGSAGRLDGCTGSGDVCRALVGHAEASTRSRLALSYFRASDAHVVMTFVPW